MYILKIVLFLVLIFIADSFFTKQEIEGFKGRRRGGGGRRAGRRGARSMRRMGRRGARGARGMRRMGRRGSRNVRRMGRRKVRRRTYWPRQRRRESYVYGYPYFYNSYDIPYYNDYNTSWYGYLNPYYWGNPYGYFRRNLFNWFDYRNCASGCVANSYSPSGFSCNEGGVCRSDADCSGCNVPLVAY